jgi:hypothetical protein
MMQIEDWVSRARKWIILEAADGKVASSVDQRLRLISGEFPAVGALFKAVDVGAGEQELDIGGMRLVAPEEVDVSGQAAWVVLQGWVDEWWGSAHFSVHEGATVAVGRVCCGWRTLGGSRGWDGGDDCWVHTEVDLESEE